MLNDFKMLALCGILSAFIQLSSGHTWNEQLAIIASDGNFTGAYGYSRGYVARTDAGFNDDMMTYLLPPDGSNRDRIDSTDLVCAPTQATANQTTGYPRLQVAPGSYVAMKYLENGHVTEPYNQPGKPPMAGTVYVFGTTQPNPSETLMDVMQWTADGKGGDQRGVLLAAENFDDGRCHQINSSPMSVARQAEFPDPIPGQPGTNTELWCETDIQVPKTGVAPGSTYTVYWVWQWPTAPGVDPTYPDGKDEYYTTCSDFDVVASAPDGPVTNTLLQQDPMSTADAAFTARTALTPSPAVYEANATASAASGVASSTSLATTTIVPLSSMASTASSAATLPVVGTNMPLSTATLTSTPPSTSAGMPTSIANPPSSSPSDASIVAATAQSSFVQPFIPVQATAESFALPSTSTLPSAPTSTMDSASSPASASGSASASASTHPHVHTIHHTHTHTHDHPDAVATAHAHPDHHAKHDKHDRVYTATILVTATIPAGHSTVVVQGVHDVTFVAMGARPERTGVPGDRRMEGKGEGDGKVRRGFRA